MAEGKRKCVKCGKDATVNFGSDPDMAGVPSCEECKGSVHTALIIAVTENRDFYKVLKTIK
jgi:NAD-dependent SIR2 family protein deacetylase